MPAQWPPLKPITPHKLRSTYGTSLYRETGDIYLVADVLGHSDVNTTKRHYAALEDERRRSARNKVQLRESGEEMISPIYYLIPSQFLHRSSASSSGAS